VDGFDDLAVVDALEVDRGHAEVRVAELALNDVERHALARHLNGVGVAQLVGREAAADACLHGETPERGACCGRGPRPAGGWSVDDAQQSADGQLNEKRRCCFARRLLHKPRIGPVHRFVMSRPMSGIVLDAQ
jgi:hypothetical protein